MKRFLIISGIVVAIIAVAVVLAFPAFKRHFESVSCGNYMAAIGCAARIWAEDNNTNLPSDFISMSNELVEPKILICPGDHSRRPATNWASFTTNNCSYEIVTQGLRDGDSNGVFFRCKIHGYLGHGDATVFDGKRKRSNALWFW